MAVWIRTNDDGETIAETVRPADGKSFQLRELQSFVGGSIEALRLTGGEIMWLNEDGKNLELPYNTVATLIALERSGIAGDDFIVGAVLVANHAESGEGEQQ